MNDELAALRKLGEAIWKSYRGEIWDWCGHHLAVELTAERFAIPRAAVERIVARHDASTFL